MHRAVRLREPQARNAPDYSGRGGLRPVPSLPQPSRLPAACGGV